MRAESSLPPLALGPAAVDARGARGWRGARRRPGDVVAVVLLAVLPAVIFGLPALLGHAVWPGDDLTQNLPLRILAGREIRAGHLPLYDPYIWSGAPLLAGWNAAAAYPLTWLFAILPATAAWTVNMIVTWAVAGLGMFCFLRALRLGSLASFLGALSFAFAGGMSAQVTHFGLVAGLSWVPLVLLAILRLSQSLSLGARLGWMAVLGTAFGLVILAGEPRAIDDACVIAGIYALWQVGRLGRRRAGPATGPAAASVAASVAGGLALGVGLGAVQWLPGLATISSSQRGVDSMALYSSGSLPVRWVLLTLVPDLLGGSGSLGQPSFFGFYNLTEVTSYVGILPLVAAFALLGRVRWRSWRSPRSRRSRLPEWLVWHVMALAGVALALGGNTPLGDVLYHLPLFGDQRLQSRNILVLDLALTVLLAYWVDQRPGPARARRVSRETVLGMLPPLAVVAAVVLAFTWGVGWIRWVGLNISPSASVVGRLKPWLLPYAVLGAGAALIVLAGWRLGPRLRARLIAGFVVVDVIVFTVLCVVEVGGGLFSGSGASAAAAAPGGSAGVTVTTAATGALRPVGALGYPGRFAIYDPDLLDAGQLSSLDPPDNNAVSDPAMPSMQGYTSTVDGLYASVTGSHLATGDGQDTLAPKAVADGTLDQLDTTVLLTPAAYLVTTPGRGGPAAGPAGTGRREVSAGQQTTWYLGGTSEVSRVSVPDAEARQDAAAGIQLGLMAADGSVRWFQARAATPSSLAVTVSPPVTSVAVVARVPAGAARRGPVSLGPASLRPVSLGPAALGPVSLGPASVVAADGSVSVADGQLAGALVPPHWDFAGFDGPFAVFANQRAQAPLRIQALPGRSAAGAWIGGSSGPPAEPTAATVSSPQGVRVVRAVADIAGWSATWHPRQGPATALTVEQDGLVQAVDVPPGEGLLTWSYTPPGFRAGLALSFAAAVLISALFVLGFLARRRRWLTAGP